MAGLPRPDGLVVSCYRILVPSSWMPGRRLRKVDCACVSTASDVAVVMAFLFGCLDGEERAAGILVLSALRQRRLLDHDLEA